MRILITADLHYDSPRSRQPAKDLAAEMLRTGGDALVLIGDCASAAHQNLRDCLAMFDSFPGRKFLVPGNHCLWCQAGEDSLQRYEKIVPALAEEEGFTVLDHSPAVLGDLGLVGSVGWYDYSYREHALDIPLEFYQAKVAPGAARYLPQHRPLHEAHRHRLHEAHYEVTTRWMDGVHVRLPMSDLEFLDYLVDKLRRQLADMQADPRVAQVAAFTHHLPFEEMVPRGRPAKLAFAAAYMGSDRLGQALLACPKLRYVYCGHSHWPHRGQMGQAQVVNVGSTYIEKRLEILEVPGPGGTV